MTYTPSFFWSFEVIYGTGVQANGLQYMDSPFNGTGLETMK